MPPERVLRSNTPEARRDAMVEISALLDRLRRDPIESVGLVEALRRQSGARFSIRRDDFDYVSRSAGGLFSSSGAMTPFFALSRKHSRILQGTPREACRTELATKTKEMLFLESRDDGCRFDAQSPSAGMGLRNMRFRAEQIGAELEIQSEDGEGSSCGGRCLWST